MATYYFLNTDLDEDWANPNNWYNDAGGSSAANLVPTSSDDVVILSFLSQVTSGSADVTNMTIEANVTITATVSGTCTVQNFGYLGDGGYINGNVVCTTDGVIGLNNNGAYINGNLTFYNNGSTESSGAITVTSNLYLESNWTGSIYNITVSFNAVYSYGYTGTSTNISATSGNLYANYPALYFTSTDYDWNNLNNNWYVDSGITQKAAALPSSSQDVYLTSNVYFNTGSPAEANNLYVDGNYDLDITVTVSGTATFSNGAEYGTGSGSPAVTLTVSSFVMEDYGSVKENATVTISGDQAYFYDTSYNIGVISGNTSFYDSSSNASGGTVSGDANFNNTSINYGTAANAHFYDSSSNGSTGNVTGTGTAYYPVNRNSFNSGTISFVSYSGYPTFYWYGGNGNWDDPFAWWTDSGHTTQASYIPSSLDDVVIENSYVNISATVNSATVETNFFTSPYVLTVNGTITFNNGSLGDTYSPAVVSASVAVFNNSTEIRNSSSSLTTTDYVEFNDSSINYGSINSTNPVIFRDSSSNASGGYVTNNADFYDTSTNAGTINGNATVYSPHPAPFDSNGGNTGTVSGTISYSGYSARTVYYGGSTNGDWATLTNWWDNDTFTTQAAYVPDGTVSIDNVVISGNISMVMTGPNPPVVNALTMNSGDISISVTCASAQFNNSSTCSGTLTINDPVGTITFSDVSSNTSMGSVTTLTGEVIFEDSSTNSGMVTTTNGNINIYYPVVIPMGGTLSPGFGASVVYFNYPSYFNDTSSGTFDGNWNTSANWYLDPSNNISAGSVPTETYPGINVILQTSITNSTGGSPTAYNLSCGVNSSLTLNVAVIVNGLATFENNGTLGSSATITGNALFKDTSTCQGGIITGTATFTLTSAAEMIYNGYDGTYGMSVTDVLFEYGKGVNGSSILGIV